MHGSGGSDGKTYAITQRPVLALVVCILAFGLSTVHNTLPGAFPAMFLRGSIQLSLTQVGVLSGLLYVGVMISSPVAGRWGDSAGRKLPLLVCTALAAIGAALMATAPSYAVLLAARLLCGFGSGGIVPLVYAYLVDVLPPRWRGPSSLGMAAVGGGAAAFSTLFIVRLAAASGPDGWRLAMWGFAGLAVVTLAALWLFVDSPVASVARPESDSVVAPQTGTLWSDHRRAFLAVMIAAASIGLMNAAFFVGMVPILLARGFDEQAALGMTGIAVFGSLLSLAFGALLGNRVPRHVMISGASLVSLISLVVFAVFRDSVGATLGAAGTVFGAGLAFGAIPLYAAEAFPDHLRGRAAGIVSGLVGMTAMIAPLVVNVLLVQYGEIAPLLLVGMVTALVPAVLLSFGPRPSAAAA